MSEVRHFAGMVRRAPRGDVAVLLITFLLTVFGDLVLAVNVGVILAMFQFLRRMSTAVEVQPLGGAELDAALSKRQWQSLPPGVMVYAIDGPFFFGAVDTFERSLAQTHTDPKWLILMLQRVPFMDITGIQSLEEALRDLKRRGVNVLLCGANPRVKAKLDKAGLLDIVGAGGYHDGLDSALTQLEWGATLDHQPGRHQQEDSR
jgi:SulP family sulfate permease